MKSPRFYTSRKFWKRLLLAVFAVPLLLFGIVLGIVYWKQEAITQHLLETLNSDMNGRVTIEKSHVAPFANFPYISVDLEQVQLFASKNSGEKPVCQMRDVYVGFDLWSVLGSGFEVKSIKLSGGHINLIQHKDGTFNISQLFASRQKTTADTASQSTAMKLKSITLDAVHITKYNEENGVLLSNRIDEAKAQVELNNDFFDVDLETAMVFTLVLQGDTSFLHDKHLALNTGLHINHTTGKITLDRSEVKIEKAAFTMEGAIDVRKDMLLDLKFSGNKPNFELLLAFAPPELTPFFEQYDNRGQIYFDCTIKGPSINGLQPAINATFGCSKAYFDNTETKKKLDQMQFKGSFTNGEARNASTMKFTLQDFFAKPDAGKFTGNLTVTNFIAPDIDLKLNSDFDLEFLARFLNIKSLSDLKGRVVLGMNFHDLIDPNFPERSLERLNESYETTLEVTNLSFLSSKLPVPLNDLDLKAHLEGHTAQIDYCRLVMGNSDLSINGSVSDLPAILHHTSREVESKLALKSNTLDLKQLTARDSSKGKPVDEVIKNLSMNLHFVSSARAITESPNLPAGEFYIDNLFADLQHFPHTLHDFHADVLIDSADFNVIDFSGMVDESDFHFDGKLTHYDKWFEEHPKGDTKIEFDLTSKLLQLSDMFTYRGKSYIPEDWSKEEIKDFRLHGVSLMHFENGWKFIDLQLDRLQGAFSVHPIKLNRASGRFHWEKDQLTIENFSGQMGKTDWLVSADYFLGKEIGQRSKRDKIHLQSSNLDFDELFSYKQQKTDSFKGSTHDSVFNIYTLPFPDLEADLRIGHLKYHKYNLNGFSAKLHTTPNHVLEIDTLHTGIAGGQLSLSGRFDGSNPNHIMLYPVMSLQQVNMDQLLFKFDNFGQNYILSENLHGKANCRITGFVRMHADLVPMLEESDLKINAEVMNGSLNNYAPLQALSNYFGDKNLNAVRFDTLRNEFTLKNGLLKIPLMTINSTLGFLLLEGEQQLTGQEQMQFHFRIPFQLVTGVARNKLFGRKSNTPDTQGDDEIQYMDEDKNTRFIHLSLSGTSDNFTVKPVKPQKKRTV
ncbi:MAG: AsmA-like C-terminal region-containing protein [Bacteroidia bacterium]